MAQQSVAFLGLGAMGQVHEGSLWPTSFAGSGAAAHAAAPQPPLPPL